MHSAITAFIGLRPLIAGPPFIEFRVRKSVAAGTHCYATPGRISPPLPPWEHPPSETIRFPVPSSGYGSSCKAAASCPSSSAHCK